MGNGLVNLVHRFVLGETAVGIPHHFYSWILEPILEADLSKHLPR